MMRRFIGGLVIAACSGAVVLLGAERATLVLGDGERLRGTIVSRDGYRFWNRDNVSRGLRFVTEGGREVEFRLDQIAMIQLGRARPSRAELAALYDDRRSYDGGQLIVWRDGSIEPGRFLAIADRGDDVRWETRNGRIQTIRLADLSRIYLNVDRARRTFNDVARYPDFRDDGFANPEWRFGSRGEPDGRDGRLENRGGGFDNRDGGDGRFENRDGGFANRDRGGFESRDSRDRGNGNNPNGAAQANVRVNANQAWTNTGIEVRAGDLVTFRTSGRINFGQGGTQTAGPDGNDAVRRQNYPVTAMPVGGLIGRVGNSAPFPIGSNTQPIRMPADGALLLGVNDNELGDNSGAFTVDVARQ